MEQYSSNIGAEGGVNATKTRFLRINHMAYIEFISRSVWSLAAAGDTARRDSVWNTADEPASPL